MACAICGGAGWLRRDLPTDDPDFGRAVPCRCKTAEILPGLRQWSGLGRATREWTLDNFPGDPAAAAAARQALAAQSGLWVFWSRSFGTGKTGILVAAIQQCWDAGLPALYQSVPAMLDRLRASYRDGDYAVLMHELKHLRVLALDEFHRWYQSVSNADTTDGSPSWAAEKIFQIVEHRYEHWDELLTFVATNRAPDQGEADPIASRFSDTLRSHLIAVRGGDIRPHASALEEMGRKSRVT